MKTKKFSDAVGQIDSKYIEQAICYKKEGKKPRWAKWGAAAACACLLCMGVFLLRFQQPQRTAPSTPQPAQEEEFVAISSLLAGPGLGYETQVLETAEIPIGQYTGIYEKVASAGSGALAQSRGTAVVDAQNWYRVSGHADLQYLIRAEQEGYSLWKFMYFDSGEYPYSDVLQLVYQIHSASGIAQIEVGPATMDNTDAGKAAQAEIGTRQINDRDDIEALYEILSTMNCYGENQWDKIDYGDVEAAADQGASSSEAVRLGRYITLVTSYGNAIDGLKYTAVSGQFYEYGGIAYHPLAEEQAARIDEIFHIEKTE